jgi:PAS domain S-box-containing protein
MGDFMKDDNKTTKQPASELSELRSQNAALKKSITGNISAEIAVEEARRYAENIVETVREPLLVLDADLKIVSANRNFYRTFEVNPGETIGSFIYDLGNKQWDIPRLRELLEEVLPEKEAFDDFEVSHTFQNIGHKIMLLNGRQIYRKDIGAKMILLAIEDITQRRKLEEAHNNLAAIVESADDAIIGKDLEGIIVSWNRGAEIAYGYDAKEVIGKSISLLMPPSQPDEYKELLKKRSRGELVKNYETQRMRKDGKIVDVSLTISPVKDTSGEITGDSIIAHDITERKEIENGLEKVRKELEITKISEDAAREYAESIINTVREPLAALDQDLRVVTASRSFYNFFKVKPEETVGRLIYDLGNKQWDIPKLRELLETILPQKTTFDNYEVEHDFAIIGNRIMLLNARQIKRGFGKERIILLAIEDITERKRLEDLLTESEERYRRLFETASDGIVLLEKREGKITHANPATEKMLGYTKKESIGSKLQDIGVLLDAGDFQTTMQNLNKIGILNYDDVPIETKSGQHIDTDIYLVDRARLVQCNIRDITERRQVEESLRKTKETYRLVVDNMADVITVMDLNLHFTYVSPSVIRLRGYTAEEVMAQSIEQVMTPESLQIVARVFEEELKLEASGTADPGRTRILELEEYRKDGSTVWLENHLSSFRDKENKLAGIIALSHDITERKQGEEALRNSEGRLRTLVQTIPDLIWLKDKEGVYLSCNTMFERFFGAREADIVGKTDYGFVDRKLADSFREHDRKAMAAGKPTRNEEWITFADDGHHAFLETIKTPMHDAQGTLVGVLGIGRDITERKRSEETLKESENKYRLLADNVNDVIFVLDMNLNYTYISPSVKFLRGYETEEVMKQQPMETMTPSSGELVMRTLSEVMELEKSEHRDISMSRTLQLEVRRKDGTTVWTEVKFSFIRDRDQRPVGILGLTRDITERRRTEEELKQSEERYRSIFESAQEGIFRSTPEGKLIMANPAMATMFGYESPAEMIAGATDVTRQQYVNPEDRRKLKEIIDEHGFIKRYEAQNCRKDGSIFWVSLTMHAVCDEKGESMYYDGMIEDITDRKQKAERIRKALAATVKAIAVTVETRDPYTAGHQRRVADLAFAIAAEMNLSVDQMDGIRMAAAIHDLGKISIPAEILSKPTKLTNLEFSLIKTHSQSGYDILRGIDFPWPVARTVLDHHEKMDGSGYPNGLTGDKILLESRILAVADVVESMASHRPYRPSLGLEAALEEIKKNRGTFYDNAVADACLRLFREKGYQLEGA